MSDCFCSAPFIASFLTDGEEDFDTFLGVVKIGVGRNGKYLYMFGLLTSNTSQTYYIFCKSCRKIYIYPISNLMNYIFPQNTSF